MDASTISHDPAGVAQVPSPLQNVVPEAEVPELRLATGRFHVTHVERGNQVAFVNTPLAGVPSAGVTNTGDVAKTRAPLHVSSLMTPFNCAEVVAQN